MKKNSVWIAVGAIAFLSGRVSAENFADHSAVVLEDGVKMYKAPFSSKSALDPRLNTGDTVHVVKEERHFGKPGTADVVWLAVRSTSDDNGWVSADQLAVFQDENLYTNFISATMPLAASQDSNSLAQEKINILNSADFIRREMKNANPKVRRNAALRFLQLPTPAEITEAWINFQKDSDSDVRKEADQNMGNNTIPPEYFSKQVFDAAVAAIQKTSDPDETDALVKLIYKGQDEVGQKALIIEGLKKKSPAAIYATRTLDKDTRLFYLKKLVTDADVEVVARALNSIRENRDVELIPDVIKVLESSGHPNALLTLATFIDQPGVSDIVARYLMCEVGQSQDVEAVHNLILTLQGPLDRSSALFKRLLHCYDNANEQTKKQYIASVTQMPESPFRFPIFQKALEDKNPAVFDGLINTLVFYVSQNAQYAMPASRAALAAWLQGAISIVHDGDRAAKLQSLLDKLRALK